MAVLTDEERLDWLRLMRTDNVGPVTFCALLSRFGSAAAALQALPELSRRGGRSRPLTPCPPATALRELEALTAFGARLIARGEPEYPPLLAPVAGAPPLLSVKGDLGLLAKPAIAVVGTRNASVNGRLVAERLATELGRAGLLVVSGLARGIDAAAHRVALATGTAAVVAGGIDVIYPEENSRLYGEIATNGVLVSEIAIGIKPQSQHFPRRNRIISGMAQGVVVVEAAIRSGALITARYALEQGREVFAVPGSPLDPRARGANDLIRQGATLTETAADVLQALLPAAARPEVERPAVEDPPLPSEPVPANVDGAHATVAEALSPAPATVDEIIRNCQLSPAVVATVLLEWELAGRLERHPGNRVSLVAGP
jgi:DNA processing protein